MRRLLVFALLLPGVAFADHICTNSPNEVPIGMTQGGQGQAPVPICRWVQSNETPQHAPTQQAPRTIVKRGVWGDRWGAIASDRLGAIGVSYDMPTQKAAEDAAKAQCATGSKQPEKCINIEYYYANQCVAFVSGEGLAFFRADRDIDAAKELAMSACAAEARGECKVVYSDCSEAVFLGYE